MAVVNFTEPYGQYKMNLDDPRRTCFVCGDVITEQLGIVWRGSAAHLQDIFLHDHCSEHLAHHLIMDAYKLGLEKLGVSTKTTYPTLVYGAVAIDLDGDVLKCPKCGYNYLHQGKVEESGAGLLITFTCEGCGLDADMAIEQHKGNTLIDWRIRPDHQESAKL